MSNGGQAREMGPVMHELDSVIASLQTQADRFESHVQALFGMPGIPADAPKGNAPTPPSPVLTDFFRRLTHIERQMTDANLALDRHTGADLNPSPQR